MKRLLLLVLGTALGDFEAPKFDIDLALAPEDRWKEISTYVIEKHGWEGTYGPLLAYFEETLGHDFFVTYDSQLQKIIEMMSAEYGSELKGIYSTLTNLGFADRITLGEIAMLQLYYELNPYCTGMLVENSEGNMLHGRNMDYSLPGLANITVDVSFLDGESKETIMQSTTFLGYVGVVTGMRNDGWAIQVNQRFKLEIPILHTFIAALNGFRSVGLAVRDELMSTEDFSSAVEKLSKVQLMAPLYLIMSGLDQGEGAILIGDRDGVDDGSKKRHEGVVHLGDDAEWYLVQTNHDPWLRHVSDGREEFAEGELASLGQDSATLDTMRTILSTPPSLAKGTVYTTMMSASTNHFQTTVRTHDEHNEI